MKKGYTRKNKKSILNKNKSNRKIKSNRKRKMTQKKKRKMPFKKRRTYTKKEYNSGDGMLTSVWGPSLWHYLHTMSFNYPVHPTNADKKHYRDFILNLQYVLPCKHCRINLATNLKQLPLTQKTMDSRDSFSRYVYNLHELVNKMLKKKSNLRFCDVRERYEHFRSRCTDDKPELFKFRGLEEPKTKSEMGCTEPLYGKKSKCILKIVPQDDRSETFQMDKKCEKVRE